MGLFFKNGLQKTREKPAALRRALEEAGVEFTNGEQPGVRFTKAAAASSAEPAGASNPTVAAKATRGKAAKATEKKR